MLPAGPKQKSHCMRQTIAFDKQGCLKTQYLFSKQRSWRLVQAGWSGDWLRKMLYLLLGGGGGGGVSVIIES